MAIVKKKRKTYSDTSLRKFILMVCHFLISATFQLMIIHINETNNKQIDSNNLYVYMCVQRLYSLIHGYDQLRGIKIYIYI